MSDDIRPTAADLARDLRADLIVVERAAPGPWNSAARIDGAPDDADVFIPTKPRWGGPSILTISPYTGKPKLRRNEDARAIGLMREAWPAAIRRALAAEAEAERLRGLIGRDHTGLAAGLVKALRAVRSWDWLRRIGEWGSYSYEQRTVSTLREEINGCLGEIEAAAEAALRQAGDLSRGVSVTDDDGEAD